MFNILLHKLLNIKIRDIGFIYMAKIVVGDTTNDNWSSGKVILKTYTNTPLVIKINYFK